MFGAHQLDLCLVALTQDLPRVVETLLRLRGDAGPPKRLALLSELILTVIAEMRDGVSAHLLSIM